jgi:hypothetical protein
MATIFGSDPPVDPDVVDDDVVLAVVERPEAGVLVVVLLLLLPQPAMAAAQTRGIRHFQIRIRDLLSGPLAEQHRRLADLGAEQLTLRKHS